MLSRKVFADWLKEVEFVTEVSTCEYCPAIYVCEGESAEIKCADWILQYLGDIEE